MKWVFSHSLFSTLCPSFNFINKMYLMHKGSALFIRRCWISIYLKGVCRIVFYQKQKLFMFGSWWRHQLSYSGKMKPLTSFYTTVWNKFIHRIKYASIRSWNITEFLLNHNLTMAYSNSPQQATNGLILKHCIFQCWPGNKDRGCCEER